MIQRCLSNFPLALKGRNLSTRGEARCLWQTINHQALKGRNICSQTLRTSYSILDFLKKVPYSFFIIFLVVSMLIMIAGSFLQVIGPYYIGCALSGLLTRFLIFSDGRRPSLIYSAQFGALLSLICKMQL